MGSDADPPPAGPAARSPAGAAGFATTHWSLVLAAGGTNSREIRPALSRLVETYWFPLYAFVRRKGHGPEDACDLTQEFLTRLLERNFLSAADPSRGRFRSFLITALDSFLVDEWKRANRLKRGGGRTVVSLSALEAEARYQLEPVDKRSPEHAYEREWALTLLAEALARLEEECAASGRAALFAQVKPILSGDDMGAPYAEIAARLGMSEGALKTAIHRLRRRFGDLLRAEIAATVADPSQVEEEVRDLFASLRGA